MKMEEIRAKAKGLGLKTSMKRDDLIHTIQAAEGNSPCFKTVTDCDQAGCCFRSICLPRKRK